MGTPAAIIVGAVLVGIAVLLTNHWQAVPGGYEGLSPRVFRVNRWTGIIDTCVIDPSTMRDPESFAGAQFICR